MPRKPLRRLLAGLTLTAAAATGHLLTATTAIAAESAPATAPGAAAAPDHGPADDTWWGTPPTDRAQAAPMDTWWG